MSSDSDKSKEYAEARKAEEKKVRDLKPEGPYDTTNWMKENWQRIMFSHPMDTTNPASIDETMKWCESTTKEVLSVLEID